MWKRHRVVSSMWRLRWVMLLDRTVRYFDMAGSDVNPDAAFKPPSSTPPKRTLVRVPRLPAAGSPPRRDGGVGVWQRCSCRRHHRPVRCCCVGRAGARCCGAVRRRRAWHAADQRRRRHAVHARAVTRRPAHVAACDAARADVGGAGGHPALRRQSCAGVAADAPPQRRGDVVRRRAGHGGRHALALDGDRAGRRVADGGEPRQRQRREWLALHAARRGRVACARSRLRRDLHGRRHVASIVQQGPHGVAAPSRRAAAR